MAIDLWLQRRSTNQLTSVQISDARDEVGKAYKGIAELRAEDPVDIERQRMLTQSMTDIIANSTPRHLEVRRHPTSGSVAR